MLLLAKILLTRAQLLNCVFFRDADVQLMELSSKGGDTTKLTWVRILAAAYSARETLV